MLITDIQIDALKELINIGIGKGASVLNTMLDSHIELSIPEVKILLSDILSYEMVSLSADRASVVSLPFKGDFSGIARMIFPSESASKLVTAFTGEDIDIMELDTIRAGTLTEIGNIVLNAVIGTISNVLKLKLEYRVPTFREVFSKSLFSSTTRMHDSIIIYAKTSFLIRNLEIVGDLALFLEVGSYERLIKIIDTFCIEYGAEIE